MSISQPRQPKGQPSGGEFASKHQSDDQVGSLAGHEARDLAAGQLAGLTQGHICGEACTGTVTRGDGSTIQLECPYERLDVTDPGDQKIIGSLYAQDARSAMGRG